MTTTTSRYPEFADLESRTKSFRKWYLSLIKRPDELARAGFFYTGCNDIVRCFSCGGTLSNWLSSDVAWERHITKLSADCVHVRRSLSNVYIARVLSEEDERKNINFDEICKICYDQDINVLHLPCGHRICCETCSLRIYQCPICRLDIKQRVILKMNKKYNK